MLLTALIFLATAQELDNYPHLKFPPGTSAEKIKEFKDRLNAVPLGDFNPVEPSDPREKAERLAKNRSFNDRYAGQGDAIKLVELAVMNTHWEFGLNSPLPVSQSNAVLIGEVGRTRAFLSEDKSRVYSEFVVEVEEVIKNPRSESIEVGSGLAFERLGGRIRFADGQIATYIVGAQGMPEKGRKYVFFLRHNKYEAGSRSQTEMNSHILTAYELRNGRVIPLDSGGTKGGDFKKYEGKDETDFLKEVREIVRRGP